MRRRAFSRCLCCAARLLFLAGLSSSCATGLVVAGYYRASGGLDHDAKVAAAWRGPHGELALDLEELEGEFHREGSVLVFTAGELDQLFTGATPQAPGLLHVPHARLPRAVLSRKLDVPRPEPGSDAWVPAEAWDAGPRESGGEERYALPDTLAGAPLAVHWTHGYYAGIPDETGFALLLTRASASGVQRALVLPEARPSSWRDEALLGLAMATDVVVIVLLIAAA